jgi:hypothetical protein
MGPGIEAQSPNVTAPSADDITEVREEKEKEKKKKN